MEALPVLEGLLNDPEFMVVVDAAIAIEAITGKPMKPVLEQMLERATDQQVRSTLQSAVLGLPFAQEEREGRIRRAAQR